MNIIKIESDYHLFDDSEIKVGDLRLSRDRNTIGSCINEEEKSHYNRNGDLYKKILATSNVINARDFNIPLIDEKEADKLFYVNAIDYSSIEDDCYYSVLHNGSRWAHLPEKNTRPNPAMFWEQVDIMVRGYKLALKDNEDKRFTMNDMKSCHLHTKQNIGEEYLNSLNGRSEWEVEVEMELEPIPESLAEYPMSYTQKMILKTKNNFINILSFK